MARVGTGFVDIKPDLSAFGRGLDSEIESRLRGIGNRATVAIKTRLDSSSLAKALAGISKSATVTVKAKVDVDRPTVAPILKNVALPGLSRTVEDEVSKARPRIHVDVDRGSLALVGTVLAVSLSNAARNGVHNLETELRSVAARGATLLRPLQTAFSKIGDGPIGKGFTAFGGALSGLLSSIPGIGGLFRGLTGSLGQTALGAAGAAAAVGGLAIALAALAASLGAAVAGLGALTTALAAALGPVVVVGLVALARFAVILKDVTQSQTKAPQNAQALKAANQQAAAATQALAQANENLKTQLDAARRAQIDATEAVKDDRLARESAAEGIDQARLNTRKAIQALKEFKTAAGAKVDTGAFEKFTDVNVSTKGLQTALANARANTKVTAADSLELEQRILDIRVAKTAEKQANDALHDSNVSLSRDRKTEQDFIKNGLTAYAPYKAAIQQVAQAKLAEANATEKATLAAEKALDPFAGLTKAEKGFATALIAIGKRIRSAFGPATDAIFRGATVALGALATVLKDPKIQAALTAIGKAVGGTIAALGKGLASEKAKSAFITFAKVGVQIAQVFGRRIFRDFALILSRIATAALPALVRGLTKILEFFDRFEKSTRDGDKLRETIDKLATATFLWVEFLSKASVALVKIGIVLAPIGNALISAFISPSKALHDLGRQLGLTETELANVSRAVRTTANIIKTVFVIAVQSMATTVKAIMQTVVRVFADVVNAIDDLAHGRWAAAWHAIRQIPIDAFKGIATFARGMVTTLGRVGTQIGNAFGTGIKKALGGLPGFFSNLGKTIVNALVDTLNAGFKAINDLVPDKIKLKFFPDIDLPNNPLPTIPRLAKGGFVPGSGGTDSQLVAATPGEFMVNPRGVRTAGSAMLRDINNGRAPRGVTVEHQDINIMTPSGGPPDPTVLGVVVGRALAAAM